MKYRLVRVLGKVLGLDWSQININVITRSPVPVSDDFYGFPLMHFSDLISCVPVSLCYPNADQPRMDDRAAISRLYPVTTQDVANFPGKQLFYENTVRIHGSVLFTDAQGQPAQPMQGVNVVARWIDPSTGTPSRRYAAAFVSGALFHGNAGNPVNGATDVSGRRYDRFGSDDTSVEGYFDLAGLEIPDSSNSAQYQLTVEAIDTNWSQGVGPYAPWQIAPSGAAQPVIVTVSKGANAQQDLLMQGSAVATADWGEPPSYESPATLPPAGDWVGSLGSYGETDYFQFAGQANRTASVVVTALDDSGAASESKARPIIGMWGLADPAGTLAPAATPSPYNSAVFGMTRLDASLLSSTNFRIGITDDRGDGRPDFHYHARVLYADSVEPTRLSLRGGTPLIIQGFGFSAGLTATIGGISATLLAASPTQLILSAPPPAQDGLQTITLSEPATGASSVMADVLTYGAGSTDNIALISGGGNPAVPVGGETPTPIVARVTASDGTPVSGASVAWSTTSGTLSACGASACTVGTDESGQVSTRLAVTAAGSITITATLAPASYGSSKKVQATVVGISSAADITLTAQYRWLARGSSVDLPLTARVMSNGSALSGKTVNFQLTRGTGSLQSTSAVTDPNGYATTTLHLTNLAGDVQVSACVGPSNAPCQTYFLSAVALSALQLVKVGGSGQIVTVGQPFLPMILRVTDSSAPPHPVQGATVTFQSTILRPDQDSPIETNGESSSGNHSMPVILGTSQAQITSDLNGLASLVPSRGSFTGAVEMEISASAGSSVTQQFEMESEWPVAATSPGAMSSGGAARLLRNAGKARQGASPPQQKFFIGESWGVAAETGSGASATSVAIPDGQTGTFSADEPKALDTGQSVSQCEQKEEERNREKCADKIKKSHPPE